MLKLQTPSGKKININIDKMTAEIAENNMHGKLSGRALIIPNIPQYRKALDVASHYFRIGPNFVALTEQNAKVLNRAFDEKKQAKKDKIEQAIPGLEALYAVLREEEYYEEAFTHMMENEDNDGANPPAGLAANSDEIRAKYPKASIYVKAESYTYASDYRKSAAGKEAMTVLEDGGTIEAATEILENWLPENASWN